MAASIVPHGSTPKQTVRSWLLLLLLFLPPPGLVARGSLSASIYSPARRALRVRIQPLISPCQRILFALSASQGRYWSALAATEVPVNPRSSLALSQEAETQLDDAAVTALAPYLLHSRVTNDSQRRPSTTIVSNFNTDTIRLPLLLP